jgi:hypothetical protein
MKKQVKELSPEFKNKVLNSFKEGMTAIQIASELNGEYKKETGRDLTRNACLGIKFRAGKCKAISRVDKSRYSQPPDGFKKKICLKCHKEKFIEDHNRICFACKQGTDWEESTTEHGVPGLTRNTSRYGSICGY